MGPPPASRNFEQHQPIITALRQICESYPAGTCLRELLQNADDAQATEIEYILDTNSYNDGPFLSEGLQQYHGPALLVRNNSVFNDEDFESLSSIGDSRKRQDATVTGKFGQGFNSCFHWTDGPWVYSREWLLLLDPHKSWSVDTTKPGGPAWDVVKHQSAEEIKAHLKTFSLCNIDTSMPFNGSIIRIPLRTKEQAQSSKIANRAINIKEIQDALSQLGQEVKEGGLLFLKFVRRLIVRVNNSVIWQARTEGRDDRSTSLRQQLPGSFRDLYVEPASNPCHAEVAENIEVDVCFSEGLLSTTSSFIVQHSMLKSTGDEDLDVWARSKKLFPWAAVAAPLDNSFSGHLFSILRLPILIGQPVHIHGLFSITPDRGRLSSPGQTPGHQDMESKWNYFMFSTCVARAWANLLAARATYSWTQEQFSLWPRIEMTPTQIWTQLDTFVLDHVINKNLTVWNTALRCVDFKDSYFLHADSRTNEYAVSFAEVQFPAVYVSAQFLEKIKQRTNLSSQKVRLAKPKLLREHLRKRKAENIPPTTPTAASTLLEYSLLDSIEDESSSRDWTEELHGVSIWPTVDGLLTKFDSGLPLSRNAQELAFFRNSRNSMTLELSGLTSRTLAYLLEICNVASSKIRFRKLTDLADDWPLLYSLRSHSELHGTLRRPSLLDRSLHEAWEWIALRLKEEKGFPACTAQLWLVPLRSGRIRQLCPPNTETPVLIIENDEALHQLIYDMSSSDKGIDNLLDVEILQQSSIKAIRKLSAATPNHKFATADFLEPLLSWLIFNHESLALVSNQTKQQLLAHLDVLSKKEFQSLPESTRKKLRGSLRKLPVFRKLIASEPFINWNFTQQEIQSDITAMEVPNGLPVIPPIQGISFYDFSSPTERSLVDTWTLMDQMPPEKFFIEYILPMINGLDDSLKEVKFSIADFVLEEARKLERSWTSCLNTFAIIPLSNETAGVRHYKRLLDLVEPESPLSSLYFPDEHVCPDKKFFHRHRATLTRCGLSRTLDPSRILERASYYSKCGRSPRDILPLVQQLVAITINDSILVTQGIADELKSIAWLPATPMSGSGITLLAPNSCRGREDSYLVDKCQPIVDVRVNTIWKRLLGWDTPIDDQLLLSQLEKCVLAKEHIKVDSVLSYIARFKDPLILRETVCILGKSGRYLVPEKTYLPPSRLDRFPMAPYLDEVDTAFENKHLKLLETLGLLREPSRADLLDVQKQLMSSSAGTPLHPRDLEVSVCLLEIMALLYSNKDVLKELMIPDTTGVLRNISEVVYGNRVFNDRMAQYYWVHSSLSGALVRHLRIEDAYDRSIKERCREEEDDDSSDEYAPNEKYSTIISDTLDRYPIHSTFNEFLANADDCGATELHWVLDKCDLTAYPCESLYRPDTMARLQGPALFVHNDSVFSDADFRGFKNIGRGGKEADVTTTGMFGRGSMTMYHFSDNPMILSGDSLLILDPQQQLLGASHRTRSPKVGIKLLLRNIRAVIPDQLAPFHGLKDYSQDMDYYCGTIFRFPLRLNTSTTLKRGPSSVYPQTIESLLEHYFSESAPMSLIFLQNVKSIKFSIRGDDTHRWSISASRTPKSTLEVFNEFDIVTNRGDTCVKRTWRVGLTDIDTRPPTGIFNPSKGEIKITECGIAACLSETFQSISKTRASKSKQLVFCRLPTSYESQLPVSFHASFAVTGDRRTLPIEDIHREPYAPWNRWLLTSCIPDFYIKFLKDLAPRIGEDVFKYFPGMMKGPANGISDIVLQAVWKKISEERNHEIIPLISPADEGDGLKARPDRRTRKLHRVTTLNTGDFDCYGIEISSLLQPLFARIFSNLVRPHFLIRQYIKSTEAKILSSSILCQSFKDEINARELLNFLDGFDKISERSKALKKVLEITVPDQTCDAASLKMVDGCHILPLLDGSLGTLRLVDNAAALTTIDYKFFPTKQERTLFGFADRFLLNADLFQPSGHALAAKVGVATELMGKSGPDSRSASPTPGNPISRLVESNMFNLRPLELEDLQSILQCIPEAAWNDFPRMEHWVPEFWLYYNSKLEAAYDVSNASDLLATHRNCFEKSALQRLPLYRTISSGIWQFLTPLEFDAETYIVEPADIDHRSFCTKIPGLQLVDSTCVPVWLEEEEIDLSKPYSFNRLLTCLSKIPQRLRKWQPISELLGEALTLENAEMMRNLIETHVLHERGVRDRYSLLATIPIWPAGMKSSLRGPTKVIAAQDAMFCTDQRMLVSWTKNLDKYVVPEIVKKHSQMLSQIGATVTRVEDMWQRLSCYLPQQLLKDFELVEYLDMAQCLADNKVKLSALQVPNGASKLCYVTQLFDHEDAIFEAAFHEPTNSAFLHKIMQPLRHFCLAVGLRARTPDRGFKSEDYLASVEAIQRRGLYKPITESWINDAQCVAGYLRQYRSDFSYWTTGTWAKLLAVGMFRVRTNVSMQLLYRQPQMATVAARSDHCSLNQTAIDSDIRLFWSQLPLLDYPPTQFVYGRKLNQGRPTIRVVVEHLRFLIDNRNNVPETEISEYLKDIQATYHYLQENSAQSTLLPALKTENVWLNLRTTEIDLISADHFKEALTSAQFLCLDSPTDPRPYQNVREFLIPYKKLLKTLGCQSVVHRTRAARGSAKQQSPSDRIAQGYRHLRDQGIGIDVIFEAEGQQKPAHKLTMMTASQYHIAQFDGEWGKILGRQAKTLIPDMKFSTLSQMVDFAYDGVASWSALSDKNDNNEVADRLDELLDLLQGTDKWGMEPLHRLAEDYMLENAAVYIRIDNVEDVRSVAQEVRALDVVSHCNEFIADNAKFVALCRDV